MSSTSATATSRLKLITASEHADLPRFSTLQSTRQPTSLHLQAADNMVLHNCAMLITAPIYIFGAAYLISPLMGWHLGTASLVKWFGALSPGTKAAIKGVFGFPFCFRLVYGTRHLVWDTGMMLTNRQVIVSGWLGLGVSILMTVGLMFW